MSKDILTIYTPVTREEGRNTCGAGAEGREGGSIDGKVMVKEWGCRDKRWGEERKYKSEEGGEETWELSILSVWRIKMQWMSVL